MSVLLPAPSELHLPYPSWRPGQREAIETALKLQPGDTFFLEAPTGFGKSAVPAAVAALGRRVTVMVKTRDLQQQYADTLGAKILWGASHYVCSNPAAAQAFIDRWHRLPTAEECRVLLRARCPACPYRQAVLEAQQASLRVLNYHYAFFAPRLQADIFCLDEAHNVEGLLRELVHFRLRRPPPGMAFPRSLEDAPAFLLQVAEYYQRQQPESPQEACMLARRATRARLVAYGLESGDWYVRIDPTFEARPVSVVGLFRLLVPAGKPAIFMSATLGSPQVQARTLGVPCTYSMSTPSIFPEHNRPVFFYSSAPALSVHSTYADFSRQAEYIRRIAAFHRGQRGVILTASWSHARALAQLLREYPIYLPDQDAPRPQQVRRFLDSPAGTIAISPSFWEGLDLRDERCRFIIIAKVPFLSLGDPVVRRIIHRPGGRDWYDCQAAIKVVQGLGRGVRHPEDYCHGYILDANWRRVARHTPGWLKVIEVD